MTCHTINVLDLEVVGGASGGAGGGAEGGAGDDGGRRRQPGALHTRPLISST